MRKSAKLTSSVTRGRRPARVLIFDGVRSPALQLYWCPSSSLAAWIRHVGFLPGLKINPAHCSNSSNFRKTHTETYRDSFLFLALSPSLSSSPPFLDIPEWHHSLLPLSDIILSTRLCEMIQPLLVWSFSTLWKSVPSVSGAETGTKNPQQVVKNSGNCNILFKLPVWKLEVL